MALQVSFNTVCVYLSIPNVCSLLRWGRSADKDARQRREARLVEIGDLSSIPLDKISEVAANVSIAYKDDIWQNDMIYKDQDDCSKMLVCELNR